MISPNPKIFELDFAYLEIYEDYIISTVKEGVLIDEKERDIFFEIFQRHYPDKPFGYIANRKYDYCVNPTSYLQNSSYPNLVGMAVYCYSEASYKTALFEKNFYKQPIEPFFSITECEDWIRKQLKEYKEKADL